MDMIFNIKGNVLVAELFGELDHHAAGQARADIDEAMAAYGAADLVFDFSKISFMDSSGIGMILGRYRRLEPEGGRVAITGCALAIRNILNMAGVFSLIDYFDSTEEALMYLAGKDA